MILSWPNLPVHHHETGAALKLPAANRLLRILSTCRPRKGRSCSISSLQVRDRHGRIVIPLPQIFNVAAYFVDRNVLEGRAQNIAIECGASRITYQQLLEGTNRAGNALRDLAVPPDDRVLLLLLDGPEFLYCFFGTIKIGAVAIPVNTQAKPHDYEYTLNDSRASIAIVSEALLPLLQAIPRRNLLYLREIIVAGDAHSSVPQHKLANLMSAASSDLIAHPTAKDDPAFWLYSSGSTGIPKGCVHLHHDMVVTTHHYADAILKINERDRCFSVARLFFAYGLGNAGYFPLSCGATSILSPARPTPASIYADIERYRPTLFFSVPTNYASLLDYHRPTGPDFDLSSIRHAVSAGESLPAHLFERFRDRFGIEILDALGSTESLHMVTSNPPGQVRPGSSGKILPGFEARIVDDSGAPVAANEIGDLWVKSDALCAGYWNQPEKTNETFVGPWFRTGDKYRQDEDGYLWHSGRRDDTFKVHGLWLSPAEVENALLAHPAVFEAAIVARDDETGLAKPAAYVVLRAEFAPSEKLAHELQTFVAERIGGYKRPRWVEFLPELPKTATGKLQRFKLRER
jgi:benzoate-CoA ligase family protein